MLLERRAVSAAQLEAALEEQLADDPGELLGEILVRRGFASRQDVDEALSAQRQARGAVESESGSGRRSLRRRLEAGLERYVERSASEFDERAAALARRRAGLAAEEERLAAREQDVARRRELLARLGIEAGGSDIVDELFRHLDEWTKLVSRLRDELSGAEATIASRDARIKELTALRAVEGPPAPPAEPAHHVIFLRAGGRYELREADGPPPAVGEELEPAPGERYVVVKVGASPLPRDDRPCAYAEPLEGYFGSGSSL